MRIAALLLAFLIGVSANADSIAERCIVSSVGADFAYGHLFPSPGLRRTDIVEGGRWLTNAMSVHAKYMFRFTSATRQGRLYPGVYQGAGLSFTTFGSQRTIGNPVSLYLFQGAPIVRLSRRLTLGYEWNFGASMGWHHYSFDVGPESSVQVGSWVNAVINFGLHFDFRLTPAVALRAGVEATHYSNGNTAYPNPGVNSVGARIGVVCTPQPCDAAVGARADSDERQRGLGFDLMLYAAPHKEFVTVEDGEEMVARGQFAVVGLNFAPMWRFNRYFRAGAGLDLRYNDGANLSEHYIPGTAETGMRFYRQPFTDRAMAGLSVHAELTMPIFAINVGFGRNFLAIKANRNTYQQLHLKIGVWRRLWLNIGYQLHDFHRPDNLMLGAGYTFGR